MEIKREGAKILVYWRSKCIEDVEKAKEFYSNLTREGWFAVYVSEKGNKQKRVLEFKPEYERLRFIPLSEGG
ncbi:hypothetical protein KEJ18_06595 [Candidatus Bathyarchaeota archaeon]|nr:hypothetical protein [Candidatus Bathyarchaeota archaeon]